MSTPNPYAAITAPLAVNPALTSAQVFERIKDQFPNDNPKWLRTVACRYRSVITNQMKQIKEPEWQI